MPVNNENCNGKYDLVIDNYCTSIVDIESHSIIVSFSNENNLFFGVRADYLMFGWRGNKEFVRMK